MASLWPVHLWFAPLPFKFEDPYFRVQVTDRINTVSKPQEIANVFWLLNKKNFCEMNAADCFWIAMQTKGLSVLW